METQLKDLECPFSWKPQISEYDTWNSSVLIATEKKLRGSEDEGEECTPWTKFVLNLVVCYEKAMQGSINEAFQKQDECRKILEHCTEVPHFPAMGTGLKHVSLACKIFLLLKTRQQEEALNMLKEVKFVKDMEPRDQASVWAVRGAVFLEYGVKGQKESIKFLEVAVRLDRKCGEIHFLLGKAISRARRNEHKSLPSKKELQYLEFAVNMSDNVFYKVLLAQSYMDASKHQKAAQIYKNVIKDGNNNPYVLSRCAFGLMKMHPPWKDIDLAEKIILKALQRTSNNTFLDHTAGRLYLIKNQLQEAEKYFSRCAENGSFEAITWLITTKEKKTKDYKADLDLQRLMKLECYSGIKHQNEFNLLLGSYYFSKQKDFYKAVEFWWKVIETDPSSDNLKSVFNPWKKGVNINTLVIEEIEKQMKSEIICDRKRKLYMKVLKKYYESCPELLPSYLQMMINSQNV